MQKKYHQLIWFDCAIIFRPIRDLYDSFIVFYKYIVPNGTISKHDSLIVYPKGDKIRNCPVRDSIFIENGEIRVESRMGRNMDSFHSIELHN